MKAQLETDFQKLDKAIKRLAQAMSWPESHDGRVETSIQCLEFVVELYWKTMQHMLRFKELHVSTPRDAFREAFAAGWIDDEDVWVRMLKDRNRSSHTYNEALAQEILSHIPGYLPVVQNSFNKLKAVAESI